MWDTFSKMTLLHFLAIQLTELNPTETLYWARNVHFWSLILREGRRCSTQKKMCCRIRDPENG